MFAKRFAPLHVVEEHRVTAVEVLLHAGELEVAVDLHIGLQEKTFAAEPLDRRGERSDVVLARGRSGEVGRDAILGTTGLRLDGHGGSSVGRMRLFEEYNG